MKQQTQGNYSSAYEFLHHCLEINPNASEVYFMLSTYDGILKGDSFALYDMKKASQLSPDNTDYLERLGFTYIKTGDIKGAISAYEKLIKNLPERSDVLDMLTKLYASQKDYDRMIETIERIETLEGSSENTTLAKMRVYSLQGKKQEELKELKKMSEKHPNDLNYRVMIGNWLLQNGQPDMAFKEYEYVLNKEHDNSLAQMSMVDYYKTSGMISQADSLQEMMLLNVKTPADSKISLIRQIVDENEKSGGDSAQVISLFKKILAQPQKTSDMAELYEAYMTLKHMPKDSIALIQELILNIAPDNIGARLRLLQTEWDKKSFDRVLDLSKQAIDYNPGELAFYYFAGMAYVQIGDDDNALVMLKKGLAHVDNASNPILVSDSYAIMGDILFSKELEQQAFSAYDSCLQWKDDNYSCLNNYAYYLSEKGLLLDKAEQMSFRTVQAEPDNPTYLDTYAWILFKRKRFKEAQAYIDMALEQDGLSDSVIIEHAGDIYIMNGYTDKAVEFWEKALKLSEKNNKCLIKKIKLRKYVENN
ncbi:MAG: tetratricopeptide repeat protein [Prevotella sp.]